MGYYDVGGPDTAASATAQMGVLVGALLTAVGSLFGFGYLVYGILASPLVPFLVYRGRREVEPHSARDAAVATNFAGLVVVAFAGAAALRAFVPVIGWVGAVVQVALVFATAVLAAQALVSVRKVVPAQYPAGIPLVRP